MIKDVSLAYMATFGAAMAGYAMIGGSFWMWCLTAWLVGAPVAMIGIWAKLKVQDLYAQVNATPFGWNILNGYGFVQTPDHRNR